MVGVLIRMKLAVARNSWRGDRAAWVGTGLVLGAALAAGTVVLAVARPHLLPAAYAGWLLGWVVAPVLTGGGDETLRPEHFGALGLPPRRLAAGLLATAAVGFAPAVAAVALLSLPVRGARLGVGPALLAVPTMLLALVLLILTSRVTTGVVGLLLRSRTGAVAVGTATGVALAMSAQGWWLLAPLAKAGVATDLDTVLRALPSSWPLLAVEGSPARAAGLWAVMLAAAAALFAVWSAQLDRRTGAARLPAPRGTDRPLTAPLPGLPRLTGPLGAVLAKELRSWSRDLARLNLLVFAVVYALVVCGLPLAAGVTSALPFTAALAVVMAAGGAANLYGGDGTALWLTLLTPGAERPDVRGRQLAWLLVVAPPALLLAVGLTAVSGQDRAWPIVLATLPALLGAGAGLLVWLSVAAAVPGTDPHLRAGNPLKVTDDDGAQAGLVMVTILAAPLLAGPAFGVALAGTLLERPLLAWAGVPVGVAVGVASAWWLGAAAVTRLRTAGPELLAVLRHGRPEPAAPTGAQLPRWVTAVVTALWSVSFIPLIPQGILPAVFLATGVDARSWFLAMWVPGPWQWPTAVAMTVLGLTGLATAVALPRRYAPRPSAPGARSPAAGDRAAQS